MEFRKKIDIPESLLKIDHQSELMLFGSCFAENIGKRLLDDKFRVNVNPFGVLYNPTSIRQAIEIILTEKIFSKDDLFEYKGLYHSFSHHSSYSSLDIESVLEKINESRRNASANLFKANLLLVTFGTSFVYKSKSTNCIVGNCHKLPANQFEHYRLSVTDIVSEWSSLIEELREVNKDLKILFTVSPIRHWKDGAHGNQLSKAILLLAIDELINKYPEIAFYFPSYELLLDELRDYRFYAEDMLHPSDVAIEYIWESFSNTYFEQNTLNIVNQWQTIKRAINHRPFNIQSDDHQHFLRQTLLKINSLRNKFPYFECEKEVTDLKKLLLSEDL